MNKKITNLLSIVALTAQMNAHADDWRHVSLSSGDVAARVDFQTQTTLPPRAIPIGDGGAPRSYLTQATPLWINVNRDDLKNGDHVHVTLIDYIETVYRGYDYSHSQEVYEQDLEFAENGRFTGQLNATPLVAYQLNDGYALTRGNIRQELVIWINGSLYKDPRTGQNLSFDMSRVSD